MMEIRSGPGVPGAVVADDTFPKIISVDDHVVEPPDLFDRWLPRKYRERPEAPRVVRRRFGAFKLAPGRTDFEYDDEAGLYGDCWQYENVVIPHKRISAAVGFPRDEMSMVPITYEEMRPGCYDRDARLSDMDRNWVETSLSFPTFPRFCGQTFAEAKDKDLALACVRAYNDWMAEEWSGESDGRLVALIIVPLWDIELAVGELQRNARRGVRNVCFSEIPYLLGLPSIHSGYWEPLFAACADNDFTIHMHIGSSSKMPRTSPDAPEAVQASLSFNNAMASMTDFLFSGILVRYPNLRLAYSEGQIGWIPYILERADAVWQESRAFAGVGDVLSEPPSVYYFRQIYGCFLDDMFGLENLAAVGVDNVAFETDYPHVSCFWPDSRLVAQKLTRGLDNGVVWKLMRGNAIRMLSLPIET